MEPSRSKGGQRLYSETDIRRLALLKQLVDGGRSISQVAHLPEEDLRELAQRDAGVVLGPPVTGRQTENGQGGLAADAPAFFAAALNAVERMDAASLQRTLTRAAVALQPDRLIAEVVLPLLARVGELWKHGKLGIAHEHLASGVIRRFLEWLIETAEADPETAPLLLTCTPQGQRHEFGALIAGAVATGSGWRATFLGPDLPAEEIASAARSLEAQAVAISAIYGPEEETIDEIARLRELLPPEVRVIAGGTTVDRHARTFGEHGIEVASDLTSLSDLLGPARNGKSNAEA